jgi:adenylate kinase family enzyme
MDKAQSGFILDNYPATQEDLDTLLDYLRESHLSIHRVFYLSISIDEMNNRILNRGRKDDIIEIIDKRRLNQDEDRKPVIEYFKHINLLTEINGEQSVEDIQEIITKTLQT